jgi:hypothetical protein
VIGDIIEALHPRRMMAAVPRKRNCGLGGVVWNVGGGRFGMLALAGLE